MKKTTITLFCFLLTGMLCLYAQSKKQGFENTKEDTWIYTSNIPFYSMNNNSDIWKRYGGANGRIPGPFGGSGYLACRDLDNPHSQQITGLAAPEHILTFETTNVSGLSAEISFRYHYVGLDSGDYMYVEMRFDDANDWDYADYREDLFKTSQIGSFNSKGWDNFEYNVPTGHNYIRMRLVIYQNGNEYLGFDNFELITATLSNKYNLIEGFTFGPNPTTSLVTFKANAILDKITLYNVLGKEVLRQQNSSSSLKLDLSDQAGGIYLAKIESGNIVQTLKIIKK